MPDHRQHRGPHPEDAGLFAAELVPRLRQAVGDLNWLLTRGYAAVSAGKLVGDRYQLEARQRVAVQRSACAESAREDRRRRQLKPGQICTRPLWIDGYNVLTTMEAALAGGVVLVGSDRCYRDMASMHGSYRKVAETRPALELLGKVLATLRPDHCVWYLDRPVSNSGRLKTVIQDLAGLKGWPWEVELVPNPDALLCDCDAVVATADSAVLNRCREWFNLARLAVSQEVPQAWLVDLGGDGEEGE